MPEGCRGASSAAGEVCFQASGARSKVGLPALVAVMEHQVACSSGRMIRKQEKRQGYGAQEV